LSSTFAVLRLENTAFSEMTERNWICNWSALSAGRRLRLR
jgi:hypothetical protein